MDLSLGPLSGSQPYVASLPVARLTGVEIALWGMSLALILRLTIFARSRSLSDYAVVDNYAVVQIGIVFGCMLLAVLSNRLGLLTRRLAGTSAALVVAFYLFGFVSGLWSDHPRFSFYRSAEVVSQIVTIFLALSYCSGFAMAERRVLLLIVVSGLIGVASVIFTLGFRPHLSWWHTNQYTVPGMLAFVYATGEILAGRRENRTWLYAAGGIGLMLTALGTSSASTIAAGCGVIVALLLSKYRGRHLLVFSFFALLFVGLLGYQALEGAIFYGKSQRNIEQLNGRKYIWSGYLKEFEKRPFLGHGFAVSARTSTHFKSTNTHNSGLSVVLGTGVAGLAIVALALRRLLHEGIRALRNNQTGANGAIAALIAGLLNSMSVAFLGEAWMMSSFSFFCVLALFILFIANSAANGVSRPRIILRPIQ